MQDIYTNIQIQNTCIILCIMIIFNFDNAWTVIIYVKLFPMEIVDLTLLNILDAF